jgi:hypothetical protein
LFKNHITREGDAVKKTEFITEMNDVEKSLDKVRWGEESKRLIMNFAEDMKYIDNGLGEIDGVLTLIDRVTMLWHLTNCFGESFYVGFDVLTNNTPERIERYRREDEEERENIEKAEVVLRFARIIKKYDMKGWTEEVRATFMRELKYLEDRLRNRSVPQKA